MRRFLFRMFAVATLVLCTVVETTAQDVQAAALPDSEYNSTENLAFSKDGRFLREVQSVGPAIRGEFPHVRAISYNAATGNIVHVLDLAPDTWFFSATTDGRTAIISVGRDQTEARTRLLRVDMETGQTQELPSQWFEADGHNPYAAISGDGGLVSAFTEMGPADSPELVTVYRWRTKKIVATQSSGYHAGGIDCGEVTVDGKIAYTNNRAGSEIVDQKTGRRLVSYGPLSLRSPDGAWIVEFPNPGYGPDADDLPIRDGLNGQTRGKLQTRLTDEEAGWWWRGAFCGKSGKFIAAGPNEVLAFEIPSGKKLKSIPPDNWKEKETSNRSSAIVACSPSGERVAIRHGTRLTLQDLN